MTDTLFIGYGDRIPGVQFAAVPIPMGFLAITGAVAAGRTNSTRLADGSFRLSTDQTITATRLLDAVDRGRDRDAVRSALTRFRLISRRAADLLPARAYVRSKNFAPWNVADVAVSGPAPDSVSEAIAQVELATPETPYLAQHGDRLSTIFIRTAAEEGLSDAHFDLA